MNSHFHRQQAGCRKAQCLALNASSLPSADCEAGCANSRADQHVPSVCYPWQPCQQGQHPRHQSANLPARETTIDHILHRPVSFPVLHYPAWHHCSPGYTQQCAATVVWTGHHRRHMTLLQEHVRHPMLLARSAFILLLLKEQRTITKALSQSVWPVVLMGLLITVETQAAQRTKFFQKYQQDIIDIIDPTIFFSWNKPDTGGLAERFMRFWVGNFPKQTNKPHNSWCVCVCDVCYCCCKGGVYLAMLFFEPEWPASQGTVSSQPMKDRGILFQRKPTGCTKKDKSRKSSTNILSHYSLLTSRISPMAKYSSRSADQNSALMTDQ